jgi:hypothetical protein
VGDLMNIVSHGTWSLYVPAPWPAAYPTNIVFCKSDADSTDWYAFQTARGLSDESVKLVLWPDASGRMIVQVATVEGSRLFPAGCLVLELYDAYDMTDPTSPDPQTVYAGKMYDATANALTDAPAVVVVPATVTKLGLKRAFDKLGQWDQVKAAITADPKTLEEWDLATEIKRTDPLTQGIIAALNFTSDQVDNLILRAHALTA